MLEVVPITLKEANAFVEQNHRHHGPTVGRKFSIGLSDGESGFPMVKRLWELPLWGDLWPVIWTTGGRWK